MRFTKCLLAIILASALLSVFAYAKSRQPLGETVETANENTNESARSYSSPELPEKNVPENYIKPGVNILTGTDAALGFENNDDSKYFYNAQKTTELFTYSIVKDENGNGYMEISGGNTSSDWKYCQIAAKLEKAIDRPAVLMMQLKGKNQCGFWLGSNSTNILLVYASQFTESWKLFKLDSKGKSLSESPFDILRIQFGSKSDSSDSFGIDDLCLVPYYKITYHESYPTGREGTDRTEYYLSDLTSGITLDGTSVSGVSSSYSPSGELTVNGYSFVGWSQENGSETAQDTVELKNADIDLYPVWKQTTSGKRFVTVYTDETMENEIVSAEYQDGQTFTLPTKQEMERYYDKALYELLGFEVNGVVYECGTEITFEETMPATLDIVPVFVQSDYFGEPVIYENFNRFRGGFNIGTNISKPLYISKNWESNSENFYIVPGGDPETLLTAQRIDGKSCVKVGQEFEQDGKTHFAQMAVRKKDGQYFDISKPGVYTISADIYVPAEMKDKISGVAVSIYYTYGDHDYYIKTLSATDYGKWINISHTVNVGENEKIKSIKRLNFHYGTSSEGAYCYFDNIALFAETDKVSITDEKGETVKTDYYAKGFDYRVPDGYEIYSFFDKDGKRIDGYSFGGEKYSFGEIIPAEKLAEPVTLKAVLKDIDYRLGFNTGKGNGTVGSITVNNGQTVKLPEKIESAFDFKCWKLNKTGEEFEAGAEFTYNASLYSDYLNDTTLCFSAVYNDDFDFSEFLRRFAISDGMFAGASEEIREHVKNAYEAGILTKAESFDESAAVSKYNVMMYAARLYNTAYGKISDFELYKDKGFNSKEEYLSDYLKKAGIMPDDADYNGNATVEFAAVLYANALPAEFYTLISNKASVDNSIYADKLAKAGIIDPEADLSAQLCEKDNAVMLSRLIDASERFVPEKYRNTFYIIGDSLSAYVQKYSYSWPSKLPLFLSENIRVDNIAASGNNTKHYFEKGSINRQNYLRILSEMSEGDVCILALGTNDFWGENHLPGSSGYEERKERYARYALEITHTGAAMAFVCPVGFDTLDENGVYYDSRPSILLCMQDACKAVGQNIPILNFKEISEPYFKSVSAEERERIYSDGTVHYTDPYGTTKVCGWFSELVRKNSDESLTVLRSNFEVKDFDNSSSQYLYITDLPETLGETSLRVKSPSGIRFASVGNPSLRGIAADNAEYGFIVTTEKHMSGKSQDEFVIGGDIRYVRGFAYNNVSGEDKCTFDADAEKIGIFGVLVGVPENAAAYKTKFAVRSYIRIGENIFYGNVVYDSLYELAVRLEAGGNTEKAVTDILNVCK